MSETRERDRETDTPEPEGRAVAVSPAAELDFEKAHREAWGKFYNGLSADPEDIRVNEILQAQHAALLAAAVEQARREAGDESLLRMIAGLDDEVQRLQRRTTEIHQYYAPLVAAVREWQETQMVVKAEVAAISRFKVADERHQVAADALAALQLPEVP